MNCTKCGNVLAPGSTICSACGTPVSNMQPMEANNQQESADDVLVLGAPEVQLSSDVQPEVQVEPVQPMPAPAPTPVAPTAPVSPAPAQPMPGSMPNMYPNMGTQPGYGPAPMSAPAPKKSNGAFYAIVGVLAVAIIGALVYFLFFTGDKETSDGGSSTPSESTTTNPSGGQTPGGSTTPVADSKTTIGDYAYVLPTGYTYMEKGGYDLLVNRSDMVQTALLVAPGSYEELSNTRYELESVEGYQGITEETYGGRKWLVISMTESGYDYKVGVTTLDASNCILFNVMNEGTKTYGSIFTDLGKMVDTAEYKGVAGFNGGEEALTSLNSYVQTFKVENTLTEE